MPTRLQPGIAAALLVALTGLSPASAAPPAAPPPTPDSSSTQAAIQAVLTPQSLPERVGTVVLILLLAYLAYRTVTAALRRAMEAAARRSYDLPETAAQRQQRAVTVLSLLNNVVRWAIALLAIIWILGAIGVNLVPLLTGVGFIGAAIAFGSQALVRDVVSGFFVLLEGQYAVGDLVDISGKLGRVEAVGLRTTVLRDARGQLHHIPNGIIAVTTVHRRAANRYLLRVPIATAKDADRAASLLTTMAQAAQRQLPQHLLEVGPARAEIGEDGFTEVVLPFAVLPTQEWVATSELPNRARVVLAAHDIPRVEGVEARSVEDITLANNWFPGASDLAADPQTGPRTDSRDTTENGAP